MTHWTRIALAAVALAASFAAAPARADRHGKKERHDVRPVAHVALVPARPAPVVVHVPVPVPPRVVVVKAAHGRAHWRHVAMERELRHEYAELESARARFYATWNGAPWGRASFESWYAARHEELDRRWAALERSHRW